MKTSSADRPSAATHSAIYHLIRRSRTGVLATIFSALIGGCAATPQQVCSSEWIKPRTDAALADFRATTTDAWDRLQQAGEAAAQRGELGLAEQARVLLDLSRVLGSFKESQARADLRRLATTCNDPSLVSNALITTFEDYGVPSSYIALMRELDEFVELFTTETNRFGK